MGKKSLATAKTVVLDRFLKHNARIYMMLLLNTGKIGHSNLSKKYSNTSHIKNSSDLSVLKIELVLSD